MPGMTEALDPISSTSGREKKELICSYHVVAFLLIRVTQMVLAS